MAKNNGILDGLVVGWQHVEPVLIACIAAKINVILRGKHGISKTVFAKLVAKSLGGTYRHYDATKDDMISVAGIPNPEDLKKGILSFSKHDRTIWDADYISIDELTRAPRECQNMWLEILEEKTCSGFPLKYRMALATMNPATYNATYRLDEALLDRFAAVVEIPEVIKQPETIYEIVKMNLNGQRENRDQEKINNLGIAIEQISVLHNNFMASPEIIEAVCQYTTAFGKELAISQKSAQKEFYISPRRYIHLANCLVACASYYKYTQTEAWGNNEGIFVQGAKIASMYVMATPLNISSTTIKACHEKASSYLKNLSGSVADKILGLINNEKKIHKKVDLLASNLSIIEKWSSSEIGSVFNSIFSTIKSNINFGLIPGATGKLTKTEKSAIIEIGKGIDSFTKLSAKVLENTTSPVALKVSAKNSLGGILTCKHQLMTDIAKIVFSLNKNKKTHVAIYEHVRPLLSQQSTELRVWDGNMIENSVEKTLEKILIDL